MIKPLQSSVSALRWNTDIEWTSEELSATSANLAFRRAGQTILKLEVGSELIAFLSDYLPGSKASRSVDVDQHPELQAFLSFLKDHRILYSDDEPSGGATITLYADRETVLETWQLPCARRLNIDILVGDEARLSAHFAAFADARAAGHMVSYLKIYNDLVEIGAVRFPYEKALPATRGLVPLNYPAWPQRLRQAHSLLRDFFQEAVATAKWNALTIAGSRMEWEWEEMKSPYRVTTASMPQLSECVPFFHYRAQVEGESGAGGVGTTVVSAEFSATCEAWERYCQARPDLALSAEHRPGEELRNIPGVHFDYLRRLSKPIRQAPALVEGWKLAGHQPVKVPSEWVYFDGHHSASNSNGVAFGSSLADAAFGGKIEVVERHLLVSSYLQLRQGREFTPNDGDVDPAILAFLKKRHRRAKFYDIGAANNIHAVVCVVGSDLPPFASIGCSAKTSVVEAAQKALYEAVVTDSQWSRRIEQFGPKQFVAKGKAYLQANPYQVGFEESAWHWAAMEDAEERLHRRFHTGTPSAASLDEDAFVAVDIGKTIVPSGAVVKVLHPDALPLPSCFAQAKSLFEMLNLSETLTIPMF